MHSIAINSVVIIVMSGHYSVIMSILIIFAIILSINVLVITETDGHYCNDHLNFYDFWTRVHWAL